MKYTTAVHKEKQKNFLIFLQQLGICEDDTTFEIRGDYYIYRIDLSSQEPSLISQVKKEISCSQIDFL